MRRNVLGLAGALAALLGLAALAAPAARGAPDEEPPWPESASAYFSPNGGGAAATAASLRSATRTVDIAMYSVSTGNGAPIFCALRDVGARGTVRLRMLFNKAKTGTTNKQKSLALEAIGVDVRYVTRTLHEKFAIIDGAVLLNGSANWSTSADTKYSENTQRLTGPPQLIRDFEGEFQRLHAISRDFDPEDYAP
jgi:phosphatidylserine/phosphatidylglycerophosphate/cardiolipin synthase-like enzyme